MTAPDTQGDWAGTLVVALILLAILVYGFLDEAASDRRRARANRRAMAYADKVANTAVLAGVVSDHVECAAPDCDRVLCYCPGQKACTGTSDAGCAHPGSLVCDDHRLTSCTDCRLDAQDDAGVLG